MDALLAHVESLHFIRPWVSLLIVPVAVAWLFIRKRQSAASSKGPLTFLAPHLAQALSLDDIAKTNARNVDVAFAALALMTLAISGPAWDKEPNPLLAQSAPVVVSLKTTPSMNSDDIAPTRMERAKIKILDLANRRAGARTALHAYAGSAHSVTPLTEDTAILQSFLQGLSTDAMPRDGDRADLALQVAIRELAGSDEPGSVVLVLDDFAPGNLAGFQDRAGERPRVIFYLISASNSAVPLLERIENSKIVRATNDEADIRAIERHVQSAYRKAQLGNDALRWRDRGWIFAILAAILSLSWFRRGWQFSTLALGAFLVLPPSDAVADGWPDWFLTPDQQGYLAMQDKDFAQAAENFEDPEWRAYALFKSGQYEEAAESYARLENFNGAMGEGQARLRNRQYRPAVRAFEHALELEPESEAAQHNLEVAKAIVAFVETAQSQSDTGEQSGIGADDIVYDSESGLGAETQVTPAEDVPGGQGLSTDDWMRMVDTDVGDFLKSRFRLEVAE